jgi:hypothetical protein
MVSEFHQRGGDLVSIYMGTGNNEQVIPAVVVLVEHYVLRSVWMERLVLYKLVLALNQVEESRICCSIGALGCRIAKINTIARLNRQQEIYLAVIQMNIIASANQAGDVNLMVPDLFSSAAR